MACSGVNFTFFSLHKWNLMHHSKGLITLENTWNLNRNMRSRNNYITKDTTNFTLFGLKQTQSHRCASHESKVGSGGMAPFLLKLGAWWRSGFRPIHFTPGERDSSIHQSKGWVGPRTGLGVLEKIKISCLAGKQTVPRPSSPQTSHYTDRAIAAPVYWDG